MSENRITVKVEPELTPVRLEDRMDLNAEIKVKVDSHLTGFGIFGLLVVLLGILAVLAGSIMFVTGYTNDRWVGGSSFVEAVVLTLGGGLIALFWGTSAFFYGRTVLGSGQLDQFQMESTVEESGVA